MPLRLRFAPLALLLALAPAARGVDPDPDGREFEVRFADGGTLRVGVLDDKLELVTKHGVLRVAVADVKKIEFATRPVPAAAAGKIAAAVAELGSADFRGREKAVGVLRRFGPRAAPALADAARGTDPEVTRRAADLLKQIRGSYPADLFKARDADVVHTDDSVLTGTLSVAALRVVTVPFGEQSVKLADLRGVGPPAAKAVGDAVPGPGNLAQYQGQFGKEFDFTVTGLPGGNVWGTDVYTLDTTLATAAVHAGQLQPNETGVVRVRVVPSPLTFTGSVRNGVTSGQYGPYPAGGFEFVEK